MSKKKLFSLLVISAFLMSVMLGLTGCAIGNRNIGIDFTQTFTWGIIRLGNGELIEGKVTSWRDFEDGDEIQLTINGITYLTHYSNVILATNKF